MAVGPDLMLAVQEHVAAAMLVLDGKFTGRIEELRKARDALAEQNGIVKTRGDAARVLEVAQAQAQQTISQADAVVAAARQMEAQNARRAEELTSWRAQLEVLEATLNKRAGDVRREQQAWEDSCSGQAEALSQREQAVRTAEGVLAEREAKLVAREKVLAEKLAVLSAPM